jgi:hypothetical protein
MFNLFKLGTVKSPSGILVSAFLLKSMSLRNIRPSKFVGTLVRHRCVFRRYKVCSDIKDGSCL